MGPMSVDLEAVRTWLELLHGGSNGFVHICSTGQWEGLVCDNTDQAVAYVRTTDLRQPSGIYVRATTLNRRLNPGERGGSTDTACLPGLWADIDIAGPGHKTDKKLPPDEATALKIIEQSGLPEPSLWIRSGGGYYPWWLLNRPRSIESDEEREELQWLSATWQELIAHSAEKLGYFYGTECKDLARVLRIPGTINRKVPDDPRLCQLADNLGNGDTWTVDELYDAAVAGLPKVQKPERPTLPARTIDTTDDSLSPGDALESEPWDSTLLLNDWEVHHQRGDTMYWTRPGKSRRAGYSATTGYDSGRDRLYVFSSATELPVEEPLTKFAVFSLLHHGGDYSAAAADLRRRGFGGREIVQVPAPDEFVPQPVDKPVDGRPIEATMGWSRFSWDDLGNGERFATRYANRVRWLVDVEQWAIWLGGWWRTITDAPVHAMAQRLINELPRLETDMYSDQPIVAKSGKGTTSEREQFGAWVAKQRMEGRMKAMVSVAKGQTSLQAKMSEFDTDPMLLNCQNGVLDLRTGTLMPHDPGQLFMEQAGVAWDEQAECPEWLRYLEKTIPNPEERAYLQRITGYCLTGDVSEQAMFIHYGHGANGKSVFLEVLGRVLGSYSIVVDSSTLMVKTYDGAHNADVARMVGKRLFRVSETNVGKRLDEGQVKLLTGGDDAILARYPYQRNPFEFWPSGKIMMITNHAPHVSNADSIWRRIKLVGWDIRIGEEERDKRLAKKIYATEAAGVLRWALQGCLEWQRLGDLGEPMDSKARVLGYREDQDIFGEFLFDCKRDQPGNQVTSSDAYQVYKNWCDTNGYKHPMVINSFVAALKERGLAYRKSGNFRGFLDVYFRTEFQARFESQA